MGCGNYYSPSDPICLNSNYLWNSVIFPDGKFSVDMPGQISGFGLLYDSELTDPARVEPRSSRSLRDLEAWVDRIWMGDSVTRKKRPDKCTPITPVDLAMTECINVFEGTRFKECSCVHFDRFIAWQKRKNHEDDVIREVTKKIRSNATNISLCSYGTGYFASNAILIVRLAAELAQKYSDRNVEIKINMLDGYFKEFIKRPKDQQIDFLNAQEDFNEVLKILSKKLPSHIGISASFFTSLDKVPKDNDLFIASDLGAAEAELATSSHSSVQNVQQLCKQMIKPTLSVEESLFYYGYGDCIDSKTCRKAVRIAAGKLKDSEWFSTINNQCPLHGRVKKVDEIDKNQQQDNTVRNTVIAIVAILVIFGLIWLWSRSDSNKRRLR